MSTATTALKIAVLSDTHGLLRPEVITACTGVDAILHAGDVGNPGIVEKLQQLAPTIAIRGNIDTIGACSALPATEMVLYGDVMFYLVHDIADLDISPGAAGVGVVVSGHSHKASAERKSGVLYLNPGSVGPRRFKLPICMMLLTLHGKDIQVETLLF